MSSLSWNLLKNERLKKTRGASFEDVLQGKLVNIIDHPVKAGQYLMLIDYKRYIWVIPFVKQANGTFFLKTLFQSRKYTKIYRKEK